jgi:hypothetical protein
MDSNAIIRRLAQVKGRLLEDVEHLGAMLANLEGEELKPTPSSDEGQMESSPPERLLTMAERMERADLWLKEHETRLARLEPGQQSPPTTASPTSKAPSDAEPCQHRRRYLICQKCGEVLGWEPVLVPDSPQESTDPATPGSSPSAPPTTILHVAPTCACVPSRTQGFRVGMSSDGTLAEIRCGYLPCDALWAYAVIHVPDAAASLSEST